MSGIAWMIGFAASGLWLGQAATREYSNRFTPIANPAPLLADYPEFVASVTEPNRYESETLVDDDGADLSVRAWRFSYNARGIIEMPNRLRGSSTAVIMVHPWGIDDGQGWATPEPAGVCDFCTPAKNTLAARHTRTVINPLLKRLRGKVGWVMYSLPGPRDPIRAKLYRSIHGTPTQAERAAGRSELSRALRSFDYRGEPVPDSFAVSRERPVIDYFKAFPGLDAGPKYNNKGFWDLPIPVTADIDAHDDDVVIYDAEGYEPLRRFLVERDVRHVLLVGYATDMCYCRTTAGYQNLAKDFNVFLVGDATLATFPANGTPAHATNAAISFASLQHLITQISWIKPMESKPR